MEEEFAFSHEFVVIKAGNTQVSHVFRRQFLFSSKYKYIFKLFYSITVDRYAHIHKDLL